MSQTKTRRSPANRAMSQAASPERHSAARLAELPPTLTVEEVGEMLGVSRRSAYRAAARGEIPTIRLGRRLLVPTPRLLALLGLAVDEPAGESPTTSTPSSATSSDRVTAGTATPLRPPSDPSAPR